MVKQSWISRYKGKTVSWFRRLTRHLMLPIFLDVMLWCRLSDYQELIVVGFGGTKRSRENRDVRGRVVFGNGLFPAGPPWCEASHPLPRRLNCQERYGNICSTLHSKNRQHLHFCFWKGTIIFFCTISTFSPVFLKCKEWKLVEIFIAIEKKQSLIWVNGRHVEIFEIIFWNLLYSSSANVSTIGSYEAWLFFEFDWNFHDLRVYRCF